MRAAKAMVVTALMVAAGVAHAGDSAKMVLDLRTERESGGDETLLFSSLWDGDADATVTIAQDGVAIAENLAGEGEQAWSVPYNGTYKLTHITCANGVTGKVETAWFVVTGKMDPPAVVSFDEAAYSAAEGETLEFEVAVKGVNAAMPSRAAVYISYLTAAAADLDLKNGAIDGVTPKGGLKFPLQLTWDAGDTAPKKISIPVKADKAVEGYETFVLQLAEFVGMGPGETVTAWATIADKNDKTLKPTVSPYKPKKGESVATNEVTVGVSPSDLGFAAGSGTYTAGTKLTMVAEARPGCAFVGWERNGSIESDKPKYQIVVSNEVAYTAKFAAVDYMCGLADPADGGKVTGSGYCPVGKKVTLKAVANKNFTFLGWAKTVNSQAGMANGFVATTPSLVIDRTAKPAKDSKTSTTLTNITESATFYAVFEGAPLVSAIPVVDDDGVVRVNYNVGKVTGAGRYAPGKKVTLKATANKGYVFSRWEKAGNGEWGMGNGDVWSSQAASLSFEMPSNDVEYVAMFVTAEEDKVSIELAVNGEEMRLAGDGSPHQTNIWAGVYLEWPVAASALSETKVKVAGLPTGLKFTDKPVTSKIGSGKTSVVVTNILANTIYGAPTAASKTDKDGNVTPSTVKVTVTTAGKSSQTYQIDTVVAPLPAWAQGTFAGGVFSRTGGDDGRDGARPSQGEENAQAARSTNGVVSLTIDAKGKVSGKALGNELTYTLAAPYYTGFELADGVSNFVADVTASWSFKEGSKSIKTNEVVKLVVQDNGIGGVAMGGPSSVSAEGADATERVPPSWTAWQYNWKVDPWKTLGKTFDKKTLAYAILPDGSFSDAEDVLASALGADVTARVTLKFAASGAVSVAGEFVTGYDEKKQKYTTVKASGSATLVPVDEERGEVFIYLTPKGRVPHARCLDVPWSQE